MIPCQVVPELFVLANARATQKRAAVWLCLKRCPILADCARRTPARGYIQAGRINGQPVRHDVKGGARECKVCHIEITGRRRTLCGDRCRGLSKATSYVRNLSPEHVSAEVASALSGQTLWADLSRDARQALVRQLNSEGVRDTDIARRFGQTPHVVNQIRAYQLRLPRVPR